MSHDALLRRAGNSLRGIGPFGVLFRSAWVYGAANTLNVAIPFLMMPVLTRYLAPSEYGIYIMFQLLSALLLSFTGLNIHGAIGRQYLEKDTIDLPAYIGNCLGIFAMSCFVAAVAVWWFSEEIGALAAFPSEWLWAVVAVATFQFTTLIVLTLWQMEGKSVAYGILQLLQTVANIGLSIVFVVGMHRGWRGALAGQVIAVVMTGTISFWIIARRGWVRMKYVREYVEHALNFGVPLIPHTVGATIMVMTDRVIIANLVSVAESGVYTAGYQIGMVISLVQTSFNLAWVPWVYDQLKADRTEAKMRIVRYTYAYFAAIIILAIALAIVAPKITGVIVGDRFAHASVYVLWIGLGYAFNGMYKMVAVYLFYEGKTGILGAVTLGTAIVNVAVSYYLVRHFGAVGAAQATAIAFLGSFLLTWLVASRVYAMPWGLNKAVAWR